MRSDLRPHSPSATTATASTGTAAHPHCSPCVTASSSAELPIESTTAPGQSTRGSGPASRAPGTTSTTATRVRMLTTKPNQ